MHPSPAYARLQVASRLRAEIIQRLRGLSTTLVFDALEPQVRRQLALVIACIERALQDIEDEFVFFEHPAATDAAILEDVLRAELRWLTQAVTRLTAAVQNGSLTAEFCDEVMVRIRNYEFNPAIPETSQA